MERILLHPGNFIDPRWVRQYGSGRHTVVVQGKPDGLLYVDLGGEKMAVDSKDSCLVEIGDELVVSFDGYWFRGAKQSEIDNYNAELEARRIKAENQGRLSSIDRRKKAQAFNAQFEIPVKWTVGMKDVLSGLSESSDGTGRNRRTVEHILLTEDLSDGRLKRSAGSFLCSSSPLQDGKKWSDQVEEKWYDDDGIEYQPQVNCKSCLKIAERWKKQDMVQDDDESYGPGM